VGDFCLVACLVAMDAVEESANFGQCDGDEAPVN
jgi:hypothetical protein